MTEEGFWVPAARRGMYMAGAWMRLGWANCLPMGRVCRGTRASMLSDTGVSWVRLASFCRFLSWVDGRTGLRSPWRGRWGLLQHPGWASPYSVSTMGRLEETCQGGNEQGCLRTTQKSPRWWETWSLGSLWGKCLLPEGPLCSLAFTTV